MPTFFPLQADYITALNGLVDGTGIHSFMRIGAGAPAMPAGVQLFVYGGASAAVARLNGPRAWDLVSNTDSLLHVVDATGGAIIAKFGYGGVGFTPALEALASHATTTLWNQHPGMVITNADNTANNSAWMGWKDSTGAYQAGIAAQWSSHTGSGAADLVFGTRAAGGTSSKSSAYRAAARVVLPNMAGLAGENTPGPRSPSCSFGATTTSILIFPPTVIGGRAGARMSCSIPGGICFRQRQSQRGVVALGGTATTVGAAGGASALPATPVKYWIHQRVGHELQSAFV
jgi:hypothetical protein